MEIIMMREYLFNPNFLLLFTFVDKFPLLVPLIDAKRRRMQIDVPSGKISSVWLVYSAKMKMQIAN
jgi:hypothetical protein